MYVCVSVVRVQFHPSFTGGTTCEQMLIMVGGCIEWGVQLQSVQLEPPLVASY